MKPTSKFSNMGRGPCKSCQRKRLREEGRRRSLRRRYGLTLEIYEAMYQDQKGRCKICRKKTKLQVDHDHDTGRVRGLLCYQCNSILGLCKEDTKALKRAIRYLNAN